LQKASYGEKPSEPLTENKAATSGVALKHMKKGGRIIMIGSSVGERVLVPWLVPYSATKGAVKIFTQGLSREVGSRGITVNNVQPGPIDTDLNPASGDWAVPQKAITALGRYGHVDEVAALVAFVASPESSYITGANLTVDGPERKHLLLVGLQEARLSRVRTATQGFAPGTFNLMRYTLVLAVM
jgi:enoyl-[acyl-carrier-protein] reductase (NADH)